jgi:hypothetical protein
MGRAFEGERSTPGSLVLHGRLGSGRVIDYRNFQKNPSTGLCPRPWDAARDRRLREEAMIELYFIACLLRDIEHCEEHSLIYAETSLMTCMMQAQPQLAMWSEMHGGWHIERWACRNYNSSQVKA